MGLVFHERKQWVAVVGDDGLTPKETKQMKHGAWYNIFLPQNYNDSSPIEDEKLTAIRQELAQQFNGLTAFTTPLFPMQGSWMGFGFLQTENIFIYSVFAENINEAREFLDTATERWKSKEYLDQEAILVTEMAIEVLLK